MDTHKEALERTKAAIAHLGEAGVMSAKNTSSLLSDLLAALAAAEARATRAEERMAEMDAALEWYGENARLCRLIHSGGDAGRNALAEDGGKRARAIRTRRE